MSESKPSKKVWLTEWASNGRIPILATMTLNNIEMGISVRPDYSPARDGFQVGLSPMGIDELALIRKALNDFFAKHGLE